MTYNERTKIMNKLPCIIIPNRMGVAMYLHTYETNRHQLMVEIYISIQCDGFAVGIHLSLRLPK